MSRTIFCHKLKKQAEGCVRAPYPGALGQRVYEEISQEAWQLWLNHQTMLINEYRLVPVEPKAREFLETEMQKFLFEDNASPIAGFTPPSL